VSACGTSGAASDALFEDFAGFSARSADFRSAALAAGAPVPGASGAAGSAAESAVSTASGAITGRVARRDRRRAGWFASVEAVSDSFGCSVLFIWENSHRMSSHTHLEHLPDVGWRVAPR